MTESTELQSYSSKTNSLVLDAQSFKSIMDFSAMMASGISTIPKHLQKNPSDCAAVVMQAMQWGMNPYAVAQKTHIINGVLGYEAQLVNAVICSSGLIDGGFHYEYVGENEKLSCRVGAVLKGGNSITWGEWLASNQVTTKNSPLWKTNPKQQLSYLQIKNWSRLYAAGAILGVYTPDELEEIKPMRVINPDNEKPPIEYITVEQLNEVSELIFQTGSDLTNILKACKIDNLECMQPHQFDMVMNKLKLKSVGTTEESNNDNT